MPGLLINLAHLNFVLTDKDIAYQDHGRPIQIIRTYNAYSTYEGIFGRGWTFNYGIHLIEEVSGDVVVVRGSGAEDRFTLRGDGTYRPPKGFYDTLTKNPDGTFSLWIKGSRLTYAFDEAGYLTAATDSNGNTVTIQSTEFNTPLIWGSEGSGNGEFNYPRGVAVDDQGYIYVVDTNNNRIQKFDSSGNFITAWGSAGTGDGEFNQPYGVAVDAQGYIYVGDVNNHRIQKFDSAGTFITKWGSEGTGDGQFNGAFGVAVDDQGFVYVSDLNNHRIQKFDSSGNFIITWGSAGTGDGQFNMPVGVAVDHQGYVYVVDHVNHRVQKFDSSGNFIATWGSNGTSTGQFTYPVGIAVDTQGYVYVADRDNHRIQKFDSTGTFITSWGSEGTGDGEFNKPVGVAVDSQGYVYVGDKDNHRIQKFKNNMPIKGKFVTTITDASGRTISFSYNTEDKVETITDPLGREITFTYENGDMKTSTDLAGVTTTFNYDADHLLTSMTTPNGTTSFTYHDYAWGTRLETVTDAQGNTTQYAIDVPNQEVLLTDPRGYTTHYGYNYDDYTTYITDHLGNTTTYEYDSNGNRDKVIDANGKETTLVYDSRGNITAITNHLNQTTTFVYDGDDNLTDMADPLTRTYQFDYDANDNLTKITDPLTHETEFFYLSNGLLQKIQDAREQETTFTYDTYGNLLTITDPLGYTTTFTYYPDSDKMHTSTLPAPLSHTTTYEYDPLGRLIKRIAPDATEYIIHRYCSGISGITDENGLYTEYGHDNINQRTKIIHALAGYETDFGYDGNGNLTSLTDPKDQATAFEYYENDWLKKIIYPEGAEESYTYLPVGTLQTRTDANGVVTTYGYDDLHRLTGITAPDISIAYTYDAVGNLDTMTDSTGTTDYAYDALDRLLTITYPNNKTIAYTYDAVGNITSITTPFGTVSYSYYANNLLHFITLPNSQQVIYQYDEADNLLQVDYPNGTAAAYAYDSRNRLVALTNYGLGEAVNASYAYTLDGVGNRTNVDLTEPLIPGFDPGSIDYTYNTGNILATADGTTYSHDANGNLIQKTVGTATITYTYDSLNRLTAVNTGTQTTQYIYNGLGQRVGRIVDGVQTNYLIDPNGILPQVLAEMDGSNNLIAFYVYDGAGLVAKVTSASEYYFYHYDGLGSTVAITDSTAQIVNAYAYSPYGLVGAQETIPNPFTYVGRFGVMAESHGLYYMRARYYDPEVGRFINKDPIGYAGGMNLFMYVTNPINFIDPWGLWYFYLGGISGTLWGHKGYNDGGGIFFSDKGWGIYSKTIEMPLGVGSSHGLEAGFSTGDIACPPKESITTNISDLGVKEFVEGGFKGLLKGLPKNLLYGFSGSFTVTETGEIVGGSVAAGVGSLVSLSKDKMTFLPFSNLKTKPQMPLYPMYPEPSNATPSLACGAE